MRPDPPEPAATIPERDFLMALAERVDTLGREGCDSVTAVLTSGHTITFTGYGTWINFTDGRPSYPLEWHRQEQEERRRERG